MAPFSTISAQYAQAHAYSASAKATSKSGAAHANFWGRLLAARVYFSGLADEINYITAYPGHAPTSKPTVIADALNILGQSLRKSYLPDLLIRHTKAIKSQTARTSGGSVDVANQLRTIKLNPTPSRGVNGTPYKAMPLKRGKSVLLVDDICTEGNSFEAGRAFIRATGAETICLSWLKTINTDYNAIETPLDIKDPFAALVLTTPILTRAHGYRTAIRSAGAPTDLADVHRDYFSWRWPPAV